MHVFKHLNIAAILLALTLYGCGGSSAISPAANNAASYEVIVTNLTAGQPITPLAVVLHTGAYQGFTLGIAASSGLEMLAEGGNNSQFLSDAAANTAVQTSISGVGVILPGASETITLGIADNTGIKLTLVGMLAATNDGFTGIDSLSIANMAVGATQTFKAPAFDAGTEANTETAATVPALMGQGFNAARDDINNFVSLHRGVVTVDDGLATSGLNNTHRFDNPAIQVSIRRIS